MLIFQRVLQEIIASSHHGLIKHIKILDNVKKTMALLLLKRFYQKLVLIIGESKSLCVDRLMSTAISSGANTSTRTYSIYLLTGSAVALDPK